MKFKKEWVWLFAIFVISVAALFSPTGVVETVVEDVLPPVNSPELFARNVIQEQFNEQGVLETKTFAVELRQYKGSEIELSQPIIDIYQDNIVKWQVKADEAIASNNGNFVFIGNISIVEQQSDLPLIFYTEQLNYRQDIKTFRSDLDIKVVQGPWLLTARGFSLDIKEKQGIYKTFAKGNFVYDPQ